jgi:hypothetical protein
MSTHLCIYIYVNFVPLGDLNEGKNMNIHRETRYTYLFLHKYIFTHLYRYTHIFIDL